VATAIRPVGHEDRLSIVEHLDELRTRLIVSVVAFVVAFGVCFAFNQSLLNFVGEPLAKTTKDRTLEGKGPLGQIYVAQRAARQLADLQIRSATATVNDRSASASQRDRARSDLVVAKRIRAGLPNGPPPNKPVTLGVGEPFVTSATVAMYFALLLAAPIVLWQLYAFLLPAFNPEERRVALPLMAMVPVLFAIGVAFGFYIVLPAATNFLQNFNSDQFNVLVQARDYYKFAALIMLVMGIVFQLPVGILALTRLGVVTVPMLRKNRRYAILVLAVIAAALPGVDPVSMLIEFVPLVVLYELSIQLARLFGGPQVEHSRWAWDLDDDDEDDDDGEDDEDGDDALP
jgi:sec-independent protein translocase protein TatC